MPRELFSPIRFRRSFEEVLDQVADAIRSGDLRVGDRLPPERALATRMRVSRPTLREAVKILVDIGALEVRPGRAGGTFVRSELVPRRALQRRSTRTPQLHWPPKPWNNDGSGRTPSAECGRCSRGCGARAYGRRSPRNSTSFRLNL